ncbi:MAG: sensor histidine kinase [Cyclobacteriaceae bacterium]|jgi:signal transduction histidine kinase
MIAWKFMTVIFGAVVISSVLVFWITKFWQKRRYQLAIREARSERSSLQFTLVGLEEQIRRLKLELNDEMARNELIIAHEQKRIAHELHDDTVQRIVAARFKLEQILYSNSPERVEKQVDQLRQELDDIVGTLRFLINGLTQPRFEKLPFSLLAKTITDSLSAMHHLEISYKNIDDSLEFGMPAPVIQDLYYIMHEVCHNFLKSSMGFQLRCTLSWSRELLQIHMVDNGQGIIRGRGFGLGMQSLQDRASRIGAEIDFITITLGLHVVVRLPNRFSN